MFKNKKGMTSLEVLAYITIAGLIVTSLFVLITTAFSHYSRAENLTNIINEGSRHLDYIQKEIVDREYETITSCKDSTNIDCVLFSKNDKTVKVSFVEQDSKIHLYINDEIITPNSFYLTDTNISTTSNVVHISFKIHNGVRNKEFFTTIRI